MRRIGAFIVVFIFLSRFAGLLPEAAACPICGQPTLTLSERYARADVALLVQWISARGPVDGKPPATVYEVVQVQRARAGEFKKGTRVTVGEYHAGKPGNLVFLMGGKTESAEVKWEPVPLEITETAYQYIIQAPSPETPTAKRLEYFVRFLEYPDDLIANDAFAEFVNAPAQEIFAVAGKLPREKIRRWLMDKKTPLGRQAGYGLMLGLCGQTADAPLLKERILDDSGERRVGIEGLIVGYLLLTGEPGLELLERTRLIPPSTDSGELYAVQQALRYFWSYGADRIPHARIEQAMRLLLDRPELAENAITDLARWKDWSLQPRLMQLYGTPHFDDMHMKRAIIGFMLASTKDRPKAEEPGQKLPVHITRGEEFLRELRAKDPKLVAESEKFFLVK